MPRFHFGAAIHNLKTTKIPPIPEVVWQQTQENHLSNIYKKPTTETQKNTKTPEFKQRIDVAFQKSPIRETSPQVYRSSRDAFPENQTGSTPVQCLNDS